MHTPVHRYCCCQHSFHLEPGPCALHVADLVGISLRQDFVLPEHLRSGRTRPSKIQAQFCMLQGCFVG